MRYVVTDSTGTILGHCEMRQLEPFRRYDQPIGPLNEVRHHGETDGIGLVFGTISFETISDSIIRVRSKDDCQWLRGWEPALICG